MKKGLSKPISSPSRAEKFPPPLMRFMRSNTSSKSRSRSRSSPMFMRKKSSTEVNIEATQEPSSPKVTCIGQVRVRRSSKSKSSSCCSSSRTNLGNKHKRPRWCAGKAPCCKCFFPRFHKPKWAFFGCCKKVEAIPRNTSNATSGNIENNGDNTTATDAAHQESEESKDDLLASAPPRNALLLTRSRSAPYRSSSLASRFWGSPLKGDDEDSDEKSTTQVQELPRSSSNQSEEEMVSSVNESSSFREEAKRSIQDLTEGAGVAAVHPLLLTRCKSAPARTGERLLLDSSFWKLQRSFEVPDTSTTKKWAFSG